MRTFLITVLAVVTSCRSEPRRAGAAAVTEQAWDAHAAVIAAGERAPTCADAGAAMQRVFTERRQAFVDAVALDRDEAQLAAATAYIEAHHARYADLETRMVALSERCADDPTVQAAFDQMSAP